MISSNIKNIIIGVVVVGVSFFIYSFFVNKSKEEDNSSITSTRSAIESNQVENTTGSQILKILSNLKTIKIDKNFFSEEPFVKLQDYSVNLTEEQTGRENPFISTSFESMRSSSATSGSGR